MGNVLSPEDLEAMRAMAGEGARPETTPTASKRSGRGGSSSRMKSYLQALPSLRPPDFAANQQPDDWCDEHGDRHSCCICRDAGWVRESPDRLDDGRPVRCQEARELVAGRLYVLVQCWCRVDGRARPPFNPAKHRIPAKLAHVTIESWGPPNAQPRIVAENYITSWPPAKPWLTLLGDTGRGKTGLACGIVRAAYERHGVAGSVWNIVALFDRIKATFDDDTAVEATEAVLSELLMRPLLVIDDLGAQHSTKWTEDRVYALLNGRYEAERPTIVTANDDPRSGWGDISARVKSRLHDTSIGETVRFNGPDRRIGGAR